MSRRSRWCVFSVGDGGAEGGVGGDGGGFGRKIGAERVFVEGRGSVGIGWRGW